MVLKILSIILIIFIGVKSILNKEKFNLNNKGIKENTISFLQGFSISILNPKILVWFIAIYSQFMSAENKLIFNIYSINCGHYRCMLVYYLNISCHD